MPIISVTEGRLLGGWLKKHGTIHDETYVGEIGGRD